MIVDLDKKKAAISRNINSINQLIENIPDIDVEKLFQKMEDIFFFYGLGKDKIEFIIKSGDLSRVNSNEILELEGITNALLFHLKYKIRKQSDVNSEIRQKNEM